MDFGKLSTIAISCLLVVSGGISSALANDAQTALEIGKQPTVGLLAGGASGTYTQMAEDMADVSNEEGSPRVMVTLGGGSIQNIVDFFEVRGIDIAIVQSDVLEATKDQAAGVQNFRDYTQYIAKLHNEEVHILAGPSIRNLKQLQGENVGFGTSASGTSMTSTVIFNALDLQVTPVHLSNSEAVAAVRGGRLAAAVFVVGKPANYFNSISLDEGLHFLPVDIDKKLQEAGYISGRISTEDYPNIDISEDGVETIAVGAILAVYNWSPDTERYRRVQIFAERLYRNLPRLQQGDTYHPKWKEIDLSTELPGWVRSNAAAQEAKKLP